MSLPSAYLTSAKNTPAIFQAIQAAQAPDRFTQKFLEGLGFPSTNDRALINVLKALGLLDESGVPTRRYHEYLDQTQSDVILAQGIREAYADLFRINRNAQTMSQTDVKNKMKTLSEGSYTDRVLTQMALTFTTLVKLADFTAAPPSPESPDVPTPPMTPEETPPAELPNEQRPPARNAVTLPGVAELGLGLTYQINIVLPESRDQAVYDAFFKALREHLR